MNRFINSFRFAWKGLRIAFTEQRNLKFHLSAAFAAVAAGFYFEISAGDWLAVVLTIGMVIAAELINSSIESLVNLISPHHQPLAGKIKDMAAAAVLITAITALVVGCIVFIKYLFPPLTLHT